MSKIIYTHHSELRIRQRGITKLQVENTIHKPDNMLPSFKGRALVSRKFGTKTLEAAFKKLNGDIVVITAYWLKEA